MKKIFIPFLMLMGVLSTSCKKDSAEAPEAQVPQTTLTLTLGGSTKAVGIPTLAAENTILTFNVYVFKNNLLERVATFTTGLTQTISDLTTGQKTIAVLANLPSSFPTFNVGDPYSRFAEASALIELESQRNLNNGLLMRGEESMTLLAAPALNQLRVNVSRIVAKIKLGTITLDPVAGHTGTFLLEKVLVTKAKSLSSVGLPSVITSGPFLGGASGQTVAASEVRSWLAEPITMADHANRFFYVFANNNVTGNATLLTLVGTYNGVRAFFPFRINDDATGTGDFIRPNTEHTVNITIKRPGAGSADPERPSDPADLEVTVVAQDWEVVPTQNVEW